jgi:hypothetical protein
MALHPYALPRIQPREKYLHQPQAAPLTKTLVLCHHTPSLVLP